MRGKFKGVGAKTSLRHKADRGGTVLSRLIHIITDFKEPLDTRDGFFVSYRTSVKATPMAVLEAIAARFRAQAELREADSKSICSTCCFCLIHWVENYFEYDFLDQESDPEDEIEGEPTFAEWEERGFGFVNELLAYGGVSRMLIAYFEFVQTVEKSPYPYLAKSLKDAMEEAIDRYVKSQAVDTQTITALAFKPIKQYDAFLIAAHLTFVDFNLFKRCVLYLGLWPLFVCTFCRAPCRCPEWFLWFTRRFVTSFHTQYVAPRLFHPKFRKAKGPHQ